MDLDTGLRALLVVSIVSAAAPFVCAILARFRVPQVVVLIVGGVLIGPEVAGLAEPDSIALVANVGLGFLFLLAGYELELDHFAERTGRLAVAGWLISALVSIVVTGLLAAAGLVHAYVPVALALTTTALGTLLPILRDNDMLSGPMGRYLMPAGAAGEFLPIVGIAIFLGSKGRLYGLFSLVAMCVLALALAWLPRLAQVERFEAISHEGEHATSQTTLRLTVMLLFGLLVFASDFGLDVVLGAFLAGVVLRRWAPGDVDALEGKLDAVGYGFFIPVFFVSSGMSLDLGSIADAPARLVVFFLLAAGSSRASRSVPLPPRPGRARASSDDAADRHLVAPAGGARRGGPGQRRDAAGERRVARRCGRSVGDGLPRDRRRAPPHPAGLDGER